MNKHQLQIVLGSATSILRLYGAFTLTDTETDKMGLKPIDLGHCICLCQCEHLHTIPHNPFLSVSASVSVNTSLQLVICNPPEHLR